MMISTTGSPLLARLENYQPRASRSNSQEESSSETQKVFLGSPEEEQLIKLGNLINEEGWVIANSLQPYSDRTLDKDSLLFLKNYLVKPFIIHKKFTNEDRKKILFMLNSKFSRAEAESKGKQAKLDAFLKLPLLTCDQEVVLEGKVIPAKILAIFLAHTNDSTIKLKGGIARHLVLPWIRKSLKARLDPTLEITQERQKILSGNRPDWDFVKTTANANQIRKNNQVIFEEIARAVFGEFDPDFMPYYLVIVEKVICRSNEANDGTELSEVVCFGNEAGQRIDITQQEHIRDSQLFELHGFDISIARTALSRWWKNPHDKTISPLDFNEVQVSTDRIKNEDGLQSSLDLAFGMLHSKDNTEQKVFFARYVYWISHHCRSYEDHLRTANLNLLIRYVKKDIGAVIAETLMKFHNGHNMGNTLILKAMIVNALIAIKEEIRSSDAICQEFLNHILKHISFEEHAENIFTQFLNKSNSIEISLDVLKAFAFIKTFGGKNSQVQAYVNKDLRHLQIIDTMACMIEFTPADFSKILSRIEESPFLEDYGKFYDRLLGDLLLDANRLEQLQRLKNMDWDSIGKSADKLLSNPNILHQKLGFALLLLCASASKSNTLYRSVIKHFPQIICVYDLHQREKIRDNFILVLKNSSFATAVEDCLNNFDPQSLNAPGLLNQQLIFAIAEWDPSLALEHWNSITPHLTDETRHQVGRNLIGKLTPRSPSAALSIFLNIQTLLSPSDEIEFYTNILAHHHWKLHECVSLQEILRMQKGLLPLLNRLDAPPSITSEKRKGHGRKGRPIPAVITEHPSLRNYKSQLTILVLDSLKILPDHSALELFVQAINKKLIEIPDAAVECLETILKHPIGGKKETIRLWRICHDHHIRLSQTTKKAIILTLCKELFDEPGDDCVEMLNEILPVLWLDVEDNEDKDQCIELLHRKIERHISLEQPDEVEALVENYELLLPPTVLNCYRQYLFGKFLELGAYSKAYDNLRILHSVGMATGRIQAFMEILRQRLNEATIENQQLIRAYFEGFIDIALDHLASFDTELTNTFLFLCSKLLDNPAWNEIPPNRAIKEKIQLACPAIIESVEQKKLYRACVPFLKGLHHRQMQFDCPTPTLIGVSRSVLNEYATDREWLEFIVQILTHFKLTTFTESQPEFKELLSLHRDLVQAMLKISITETRWNQRLFERIRHCLEVSVKNEANIITCDDLYTFVDYFKDSTEVDAEMLITAVSNCPRLSSSQQYTACYALLAGRTTNLARSLRLLLQQKERCLGYGLGMAQPVVDRVIRWALHTGKPELLRDAASCMFAYDVTYDHELIRTLLNRISHQRDNSLIDHLWDVFEPYYKNSFRLNVSALVLNRMVGMMAYRQHKKIEMMFDRFEEFYEFSLRPELNEAAWFHFKEFIEYLKTQYPDHDRAISNLNFDHLLTLLNASRCSLSLDDQSNINLNEAYLRFLKTTETKPVFPLANQLFIGILKGYSERILYPTDPSIHELEEKALLNTMTNAAVRCLNVRFNKKFSRIDDSAKAPVDHILLELMYSANLEDQLISFVNHLIEERPNNIRVLQDLAVYIFEKTENETRFLRLIQTLCVHIRRQPLVDTFLIIERLMKHNRPEVHIEAYDILVLKIQSVSDQIPDKSHAPKITELCKRMLMTNDRLESVLWHLIEASSRLDHWINPEDKGLLLGIYYERKFEQIVESKHFRSLVDLIPSIVKRKEILEKSEIGTHLAFNATINVLMNQVEHFIQTVPMPMVNDQIGRSIVYFSDTTEKIMKSLTGNIEPKTFEKTNDKVSLKAVYDSADKYCGQIGIGSADLNNGFEDYDNKIHSALELILNLSKTETHANVRELVSKKFSFFLGGLVIEFPSKEARQLYYDLARNYVVYLARYNTPNSLQKWLIHHIVVVQTEYLICNYKDKMDDLVALIDYVVATSPNSEIDYIQRLNRYLILKFMLTQPILESHPQAVYQMLIFAFPRPFEYPPFEKQLITYSTTIQAGLQSKIFTIIKRSLDMINEIPSKLICDNNVAELGMIFKVAINMMTQHYETITFASIPKHPYEESEVTYNDYFIDVLCNNAVFSGSKNPIRSVVCLSHAGVAAHAYLSFLLNVKHVLSLNPANHRYLTTQKLFDCFIKIYGHGFFYKQEIVFFRLMPTLKKIIVNDLAKSPIYFYDKLKELDIINLLLNISLYQEDCQAEKVRIIQEFFLEVIDLTVKFNDHNSGKFLWDKFVQVNEKLNLVNKYRAHYQIIMSKFDKILRSSNQ